jgi:hypothetical protein
MCGDRAGRDTFPLTHTTDNQMYLRAFMDEDLRAVAGLSEVTCWPAKGGRRAVSDRAQALSMRGKQRDDMHILMDSRPSPADVALGMLW